MDTNLRYFCCCLSCLYYLQTVWNWLTSFKFYSVNVNLLFAAEVDLTHATSSLAALIKYLEVTHQLFTVANIFIVLLPLYIMYLYLFKTFLSPIYSRIIIVSFKITVEWRPVRINANIFTSPYITPNLKMSTSKLCIHACLQVLSVIIFSCSMYRKI